MFPDLLAAFLSLQPHEGFSIHKLVYRVVARSEHEPGILCSVACSRLGKIIVIARSTDAFILTCSLCFACRQSGWLLFSDASGWFHKDKL